MKSINVTLKIDLIFGRHVFEWDMDPWSVSRAHSNFGLGIALQDNFYMTWHK